MRWVLVLFLCETRLGPRRSLGVSDGLAFSSTAVVVLLALWSVLANGPLVGGRKTTHIPTDLQVRDTFMSTNQHSVSPSQHLRC